MKVLNMDPVNAAQKRLLDLNEIEEFRLNCYENAEIYKQKCKRWNDNRILQKQISVGSKVLLFDSRLRLFSGKLKSKWSEPYLVLKLFHYGVVELQDEQTSKNFQVNGHRVKPYIPAQLAIEKQQEQTWFFK